MTGKPVSFLSGLSKTNLATVTAFQKGYKVIDGEPYNPSGVKLKTTVQNKRSFMYRRFSVSIDGRKNNVYLHKLVALQKFGTAMLEPGVQVRHLDGDSTNNREENIEIGTVSDNQMDKPEALRKTLAANASSRLRRLTDEQIAQARELRAQGWPYKKLMEKFNIPSTGSMSYIINNNYVTNKS